MRRHTRFALALTTLVASGCGTVQGLFQPAPDGAGMSAAGIPTVPTPFFNQDAIFPAAKRLIQAAQSDVQIDMFFMGGKIGEEIASLLIAKKRAGLDVRLLHDPGLGYKDAIKSTVRPVMDILKKGGIEVLPYPVGKLKGIAPIKADHNKTLIVDGKIAMVGGMNFADVNAPNHDLMVQFGGPSALYMKAVFMRNWTLAGGKATEVSIDQVPDDPADSDSAPAPSTEEESVTVTNSGPFGFPTRPQIATLIDNAKKRIWLEMYILADDDICDRLVAAARRGVEVRVITDPNKFAFAVNIGGMPNLGAIRKFRGTPVQIQFYNTAPDQQMHAKMCLFDDDKVAVGSTNWTQAGFDSNSETTLIIKSKRLASQLTRTYTRDWLGASLASPPTQSAPGFKGALADWISFLF